MKKEVFVVSHLLICDYEILKNDCQVFSSKSKAQKAFNAIVTKERQECLKFGWEIDSDDTELFESGVEGRYPEFHEIISLKVKEIG